MNDSTERPGTSAAEVRAVFDRYDYDKSGTIDAREFAKILEALGVEPDDEQVREAVAEIDTDGSGRLSWAEFSRWWDAVM